MCGAISPKKKLNTEIIRPNPVSLKHGIEWFKRFQWNILTEATPTQGNYNDVLQVDSLVSIA